MSLGLVALHKNSSEVDAYDITAIHFPISKEGAEVYGLALKTDATVTGALAANIGYEIRLGDGTLIRQKFHDGYINNINDLTWTGYTQVAGGGYFVGEVLNPDGANIEFVVTYRRLLM